MLWEVCPPHCIKITWTHRTSSIQGELPVSSTCNDETHWNIQFGDQSGSWQGRVWILCSSSSKSTLRMTSPENLQAFDWSVIADKLKQKAPLHFAVLMAVGSHYSGVCTAAAILLDEWYDSMSALQHLVEIILFHSNASKQVIDDNIFAKTCHMLYCSILDTGV